MPHYAAFHLGLHGCKSTRFGVSLIQRVNVLNMFGYIVMGESFQDYSFFGVMFVFI